MLKDLKSDFVFRFNNTVLKIMFTFCLMKKNILFEIKTYIQRFIIQKNTFVYTISDNMFHITIQFHIV